jgi:hypothetical protein
VTESRWRRAWSIDKILYRYFQTKSAGPPSTTINLTDVHTENPERPPKWLVRICDVGIALEKLPPRQHKTVVARWEAVIEQEDAERDITVLDMRRARVQRAGGDWRSVAKDKRSAENRYEAWRVERRRVERRKAYRDGMDRLEIFLDFVP